MLIDACFERARTGQTRRQRVIFLLLAIGVALVVADAISRLIFGALGQTPGATF